jgi:hypothetical protein
MCFGRECATENWQRKTDKGFFKGTTVLVALYELSPARPVSTSVETLLVACTLCF